VGGDDVSYGAPPPGGGTWRQTMLDEVRLPDPSRVCFLGAIAYADYLRVLGVSAVHVYLTVPFVLSWSFMEAMASGCVVVGSRTSPVEEVIADGSNGFLAEFHSPGDIAAKVVNALRERSGLCAIRAAARATIMETYSLERCLPKQVALITTLAGRC
jgi:glycosyltransferase involved in cell wall biosynthesis